MAKVRSHLVLASARAGAIPITTKASTDTKARLRLVVMTVSLSRCLPGPTGAARARRDPRVSVGPDTSKVRAGSGIAGRGVTAVLRCGRVDLDPARPDPEVPRMRDRFPQEAV